MNTDLIKRFEIKDDFFSQYEQLIASTVIPYQEKILKDEIDTVDELAKSHALANFIAAGKVVAGKIDARPVELTPGGFSVSPDPDTFRGMVFQDSDIGKWIEGAAYTINMTGDRELEKRCDEVIDIIAKAQRTDGYLDTFFILNPDKAPWSNLHEAHELYCAGHLIEGAVAYFEMTGKDTFLNVMKRYADHMYQRFVSDGVAGYPGHPEVELALLRLFRATGDDRYRELALHFIDVRGVDSDYFKNERAGRNWFIWGFNPDDKGYAQYHLPVRKQTDAVGHAVRAGYLYTAMADAAAETGDESLKRACRTLWKSITSRRMYITGAIGSAYEGERFTEDYHLPNDTAYGETCAAISLIFFARKMLDMEKKSCYGDVMERALYNCVLAGMALDGKHFFYVNPLEVLPGISGVAPSHKHVVPVRPEWYTCACCPPNVARLLPSIASYAWCMDENTVWSTLFVGGTFTLDEGTITLDTGTPAYPFGDTITYTFSGSVQKNLSVRMPEWSHTVSILKNGKPAEYAVADGYAVLDGTFCDGDVITVQFDMTPRRYFAATQVAADSGKTAVCRGPIVYCAEGIDNGAESGSVLGLRLPTETPLTVGKNVTISSGDTVISVPVITVVGSRTAGLKDGALYSDVPPEWEPCTITLIPYFAWGNRGLSEMRVWLPSAD